MNKPSPICWLALAMMLPGMAAAADAPSLISKVPDGISWTVNRVETTDQAAEEPSPAEASPAPTQKANSETDSITWDYSGGILREEVRRRGGGKQARYFLKGLIVAPDADGVYLAEPIASVYEDKPFRPNVFNEFDWISPRTFAGEAKFQGTICHIHRQTRAPAAGMAPVVVSTAYIAKETRLPVALVDDYGTHIYRFQEKRAPIDLPPPVLAALNAHALKAKKPNPAARYNIPQ